MDVHHCLICSGSNYEYGKRLEAARQALKLHFPDIVFGKEMETEAIGGTWLSPFGNQLAKFSTQDSQWFGWETGGCISSRNDSYKLHNSLSFH